MKNQFLLSLATILGGLLNAQGDLILVNSNTNVGPSTTISVVKNSTTILPFVDFDLYSFTVDDSASRSAVGSLNAVDGPFGMNRIFFREGEAGSVPDPAGMRTGVTDPSSMFIAVTNAEFYRDVRVGNPPATEFLNGAILGTDNWAYFSDNNSGGEPFNPSFWAQLNITTNSVTPIRYVHDPVNPFGDITMANAIAATAVPEPTSLILMLLSTPLIFSRRRSRSTKAES